MQVLAAADGSGFVFFGVIILIAGVAIVWAIIQGSHAKKNLTELAGRLQIYPNPDLRIPTIERSSTKSTFNLNLGGPASELGIMGKVRDRTLRISRYTTGSGKSQVTWAELAVSTHDNGFTFSLRRENIGWKLVELLGFHEVTLGDEAFDKRWRINASDAATLQALLLPELREKINASAAQFGAFTLENDWIRYREQGVFSNDKLVARFEGMVGLMCDLAEAIEVATGNYRQFSPNSP